MASSRYLVSHRLEYPMTKQSHFARWVVQTLALLTAVAPALAADASKGPSGEGPSDADVTLSTGEATLSIPIEAPKGTGGFQPSLALSYSSSAPDGPFGVGWRLQLGEIRRATRFGTPTFDDSPSSPDRFEMDDELLVKGIGPGGGTEYRTQTETFARIRRIGEAWEVTFVNGVIASFGTSPQTQIRLDASVNPTSDSGPIFRWLLSSLKDVNGNVVKFDYDRSIDPGTAYPSQVHYSYDVNSPVGELRTITFVTEPRPDLVSSLQGGVRTLISRRVKEIYSQVGTVPFRRRVLFYDEVSNSTSRSRLTSTQLYGSDWSVSGGCSVGGCAPMPKQEFRYTDPGDVPLVGTASQWNATSWSIPDFFVKGSGAEFGKDQGVRFADVNGDGLPDMLRAYHEPGDIVHKVWLNAGSGWNVVPDPTWTAALASLQLPTYVVSAGDTAALCGYTLASDHIYFAEKNGFLKKGSWDEQGGAFGQPTVASRPVRHEPILVDLDGDGRADLITSFQVGPIHCALGGIKPALQISKVYRNTGSGWAEDAALSNSLEPFFASYGIEMESPSGVENPSLCQHDTRKSVAVRRIWEDFGTGDTNVYGYVHSRGTAFADLNGDGRLDLVSRTDPNFHTLCTMSLGVVDGAWLNTPAGWLPANGYLPPTAIRARASGIQASTGLEFADLNGDGLTDAIKTSVPTPNINNPSTDAIFDAGGVWLNRGDGWCDLSACPEGSRYTMPVAFVREFYTDDEDNEDISGQFATQPWMIVSNAVTLSDVNGDGLVDVVRTDGSGDAETDFLSTWVQNPGNAAAAPWNVWMLDTHFRAATGFHTQRRMQDLGFKWIADQGSRILDLDGNGTLDYAMSNPDDTGARSSRVSILDRLRHYTNGQGGEVEITYQSAIVQRDATLESSAALDLTTTGEAALAGIVRWIPTAIVSQLSTSGLDAGPFVTTFRYAGPRFCPVLRSGLGFRLVETTLPDNAVSDTFFWQAHGRAGRTSSSKLSSGGTLLFASQAAWEVLDGGAVPGSLAGVHVGRLTQESAYNVYSNGNGSVRTTTYTYDDDYGFDFLWKIQVMRPTGTLKVERVPLAADMNRWIIGRVASSTVTDGLNRVLADSAFAYLPTRGLLTQVDRLVKPRDSGGPVQHAISSWTYDDFGNVRSSTDAENRTQYFCYDGDTTLGAGGCPAAATWTHSVIAGLRDPLGAVSSFVSDVGTGSLREVIRFNQDRARVAVDPFGRPHEIWVRPASHSSETRIEQRFYHDGMNNPAGRPFVEKYEEVGDGSLIRSATYLDGLGQTARSVYATPTGYAGRAVFRDHAGRPVQESYEVACGDLHCMNLEGPLAPQVPKRVTTHDALGRVLLQTEPAGSSAAAYQSLEWVDAILVKDRNGNLTRRLMDGDRVTRVDECTNTVAASATSPGSSCSSPQQTKYVYEASGEVAEIHDALSPWPAGDDPRHRLAYIYDTLGRVISTVDPDGGTSYTTYDLVGNIVSLMNGRGQLTAYFHDVLDRLYLIDRPGDEPTAGIMYDPHTRRRAVVGETDGSYSITYAYDDFGRERRRVLTTLGRTFVGDFEYDLLGRTTKITYPDNTGVTYGYQGAYLTQVCGAGTLAECASAPSSSWVSNVAYDSIGREQAIVKPPGIESFTYDAATYRLGEIRFTSVGGVQELRLGYGYDPVGNVLSVSDDRPGAGSDPLNASATFQYDQRNRLTLRTLGGITKHFAYDAIGNLVTRDGDSVSPNQVFDHSSKPHAITASSHSQKTYSYDDDGNVIRRGPGSGGQFLSYDSANRLTCVGTAAGDCSLNRYRYDVDGNRISETFSGGQQIFFDDLFEWWTPTNAGTSNIIAFGRRIGQHVRPNATLRSAWVPSPGSLPFDPGQLAPVAAALASLGLVALLTHLGAGGAWRERPATVATTALVIASLLAPAPAFAGGGGGTGIVRRWITHDHLGNAVLFSAVGGETVKRRVFEPFGQVVAESTDTEYTPRLFTGQRYEPVSGLYDFRARWYDAETGRFLSVDPIVQELADPQTHNAYSYARNNPTNLVDPDGRAWKGILKIVIGVLGVVVGGVIAYKEPTGVGGVVVGALEIADGAQQVAQASGSESPQVSAFTPSPVPPVGPQGLGDSAGKSTAEVAGQAQPNSEGKRSLADVLVPAVIISQAEGFIPGPGYIIAVIVIGIALTDLIREIWKPQILQQGGGETGQQSGEAPAREADLTPGKSLEAGGELSTEEAVEEVKNGGDVIAKDRGTARDIARQAGGGEPIHEQPGPRAGPSGKPHYHPATPSRQRLPGHVFY
jgi:RHS repeat-associated protein